MNPALPTLCGRYTEALRRIPEPGKGLHPALLGVANLGIMAGIPPNRLHAEIRAAIPQGGRKVPDSEIWDAIKQAIRDHATGRMDYIPPKPLPIVANGKAALNRIIQQGDGATEPDLWEASPVRIDWPPEDDAAQVLRLLYAPEDLLFIGTRLEPGIIGETIRPAAEWLQHYQTGTHPAEHIILNPLSGKPSQKKSGEGDTFRGDGSILKFKYCVVEFDSLSRDDQFRFWAAVELPVAALVDSGGKSIHGWIRVDRLFDMPITTAEDWAVNVRTRLYERILTPLGVDSACKNESRLSRMPGHYRAEKKRWQRLLWLNPEGGRVLL